MSSNNAVGRLVVLEGVDGSGKTTQLGLLEKTLRERGLEVVRTREPGGTALAERIRELALNSSEETILPVTELLLMFAARAQHVEHVIRPALARGAVVLCDRFIDSSYVYQVLGRGCPAELFFMLVYHTVGDTVPDATFVIDVPDEVSLARRQARMEDNNRLDDETVEYFSKVNAGVRDFKNIPEHYLIDGNRPVEVVAQDVLEHFDALTTPPTTE